MNQSPAHYVPGCAVEYRGPTDRGGAQWVAFIRRGQDRRDCYRAAVPSHAGPDAAALAAVAKFNAALNADREPWQLLGAALSMDGGNRYAYPVGPAYCAPALPLTAPA